jgi:hypothetical protein
MMGQRFDPESFSENSCALGQAVPRNQLQSLARTAGWAAGSAGGSVEMKVISSLVGVGLLLMGTGLTQAVADTFRPERGVRCDDAAQICYDRGSPSVELTRQYLGRDAARALRWDLRREERGRYGRVFYPEPGVRCDRTEQVCYNRRGEPSFRLTRDYLGFGAARRLGRWEPSPDRGYSSDPYFPVDRTSEWRRPRPDRGYSNN